MKRILIVACFIGANNLSAQQPYSLKSCIEIGLEQNYDIRMVRNALQISKNNPATANAG